MIPFWPWVRTILFQSEDDPEHIPQLYYWHRIEAFRYTDEFCQLLSTDRRTLLINFRLMVWNVVLSGWPKTQYIKTDVWPRVSATRYDIFCIRLSCISTRPGRSPKGAWIGLQLQPDRGANILFSTISTPKEVDFWPQSHQWNNLKARMTSKTIPLSR
jgi:hypothetical protein